MSGLVGYLYDTILTEADIDSAIALARQKAEVIAVAVGGEYKNYKVDGIETIFNQYLLDKHVMCIVENPNAKI